MSLDTESAPGPVLEGGSARTIAVLEGALDHLEECYSLLATLQPFVGLRIATDAFDERSQAEASKLRPYASRLRALSARFKAWLGDLDITELAAQSVRIKDHEYLLLRSKLESEHLLSDQSEELAAVLDETGGSAWAKLYTNLISRETIRARIVDVAGGGGASDAAPSGASGGHGRPATSEGEYGLAELRGLQAHTQRDVRRRAYEAELRLLRRNAVPFAAAINGIKGQVDELARRRGWGGAFEYSLFQHGITKASLDAMQAACQERFGDLRGRMDLEREFVPRIEDFAEKREIFLVGRFFPENRGTQLRILPESGQGLAGVAPADDDGIRLLPRRNLPGLTVGRGFVGKNPTESLCEASPAPNPGLINGRKSNK